MCPTMIRAVLDTNVLAAEGLRLLRQATGHVIPTAVVRSIAPHPEDDAVLAAAVSTHAEYLVTGDRDFLRVRHYQGTELITPRAFLVVLFGTTLISAYLPREKAACQVTIPLASLPPAHSHRSPASGTK